MFQIIVSYTKTTKTITFLSLLVEYEFTKHYNDCDYIMHTINNTITWYNDFVIHTLYNAIKLYMFLYQHVLNSHFQHCKKSQPINREGVMKGSIQTKI